MEEKKERKREAEGIKVEKEIMGKREIDWKIIKCNGNLLEIERKSETSKEQK